MHQQHTPHPFALFLDRVHDALAAFDDAGIDADEGQGTDKGIVHDLEGQRRERFIVGTAPFDGLVAVGLGSLDGGNVDGRGKVIDDGIQQRLHTLVLESRAQEHGDEVAGNGAGTQTFPKGFLVGFGAFQIGFEGRVVLFEGRFDHLFPVQSGFFPVFMMLWPLSTTPE